MAPFKLKFRMGSGSSRSASQEQDVVVDSQANQIVSNYLNSNSLGAGYGSSTTLDSEQNNDSLVSMNNDQRALIRDRDSSDDRLGYINPSLTHTETNTIPLSPPPSYEHVLEENRLAALDKENNKTSTLNLSSSGYEMLRNSQQSLRAAGHEHHYCDQQETTPSATRKQESVDSSMYSCSSATSPSQENLHGCTGSCDPLYNMSAQEPMGELTEEMENMNIEETCLSTQNPDNNSLTDECNSYDPQADECNSYDPEADECNSYDTQAYEGSSNAASRIPHEIKGPEILYKSSKQLYKAVAKECGITCKMSDQCRCLDCQSRYFDCEYDQNENEKTDGGLGAGTPMFISEVMHGTACTIL